MADAFIFSDKVAGRRALKIDPRHYGVRPLVIGARAGGAMFQIGCNISVELRIVVGAIDGTALIGHYLVIGVHPRERAAMIFAPRSKCQSESLNH
jgi:hypothetical protein